MGESIELVVETVNTFALVIPNIQPAFRDQSTLYRARCRLMLCM